MGNDALESIRYFAERDKIFKVHFRNVDKPLPHFVETFVDNGYICISLVSKALLSLITFQALQVIVVWGLLIQLHI